MRPKRLLFVALTLLLASPAGAAKVDLGVITGFCFSNLQIDGQSSSDGRATFCGGGVVDVGFTDRFGIRVEPMWVSKGAKAIQRNAYWGTLPEAVFKIDCIDVPILARYDLATSPAHGYLLGGIGVSFATQQEVEITLSNNYSESVDFSDVFNPVDVALDLGLGLSFPIGAQRMTIDGRAAIGLIDINDGGTVTFNGSPLAVPSTETHTVDFRLLVTYLFPMGAK